MTSVSSRPNEVTRSAFYDDAGLNYRDYWSDRDYEHEAEVIAIRRMLGGRSFRDAIDVGGGYGRLSPVLADYAHRVTLVDASTKQIDMAERFLALHPEIDRHVMQAGSLSFAAGSFDLALMVRVLHHLPDPAAELSELYRVLRPGGFALVEVANSAHVINRMRYLARLKTIPMSALDLRPFLPQQGDIPFVNHHPRTIAGQLRAAGFTLERSLSVSNLRHPAVKAVLPMRSMLNAERHMQRPLARWTFGPSLFLFLRKQPSPSDARV